MSHKMLIVAAVGCLLVATFVAPAMAATPEADDATPVQTETRSAPDGVPSVRTLPIKLNGDCESGGAGGCPIPG